MKKQKRSKAPKKVLSTPLNLKKSEIPSSSTEQVPVKNKVEGPNPSGGAPEDQLMQALYWIWDAFDRSLMGMFLIGNTAEKAMGNLHMDGDKITVGVRMNEWRAGSKNILLAFTGQPINTTERYVVFENPFNLVPVYVYILDEDPCIVNTQQLFYANEYFKVPNPYKRFEELYHV